MQAAATKLFGFVTGTVNRVVTDAVNDKEIGAAFMRFILENTLLVQLLTAQDAH